MQRKPYKRGEYPHGHDVLCKHCGWSWKAHQIPEGVPEPKLRHEGYRLSFSGCSGYEPENLKVWRENEKAFREDAPFRQECLERRAQGDAAWGLYAAIKRRETGDHSKVGMMAIGTGGDYYGDQLD
ncbi:MAG TPA: hypothetical protein VM103_00775 [Candidatus Paceibacterota bacterium]|nr:hypothetical protein [Candidatus Paceibacterota bacterium]